MTISLLTIFFASEGQYIRFEHLNKNNGLPNNTVNCIVRDTSGFMWFGTASGLTRYDGYSFRTFVNNEKDSLSIPDNFIRTLFVSKKGTLYLGTLYNGFCTYDALTETFKRYNHKTGVNSLGNDRTFAITEDKFGKIWIGAQGGFDKFDPQTEKFEHYTIPEEAGKVIKGPDFIFSIFPDEDGKLWIYSLGNRISKFDPDKQTFEFIPFPSNIVDHQLLNKGGIVFKDTQQNLWIGTEFEGVYKYNLATKTFSQYKVANGKLAADITVDIIQDKSGKVWIATDGGGLARYNSVKDSFEIYRYDVEDPNSISTNAIYCIYETEPDILWMGTYGGGVNIYKKNKDKFITYTNKGKKGQCLSYKSVMVYHQEENGNIWIGTDGGGLNLFDPLKGTFEYHRVINDGISMNVIKALHKDTKGNFWIGSFAKGLCRIDPQGKKTFFTSQTNPDSLHIQNSSVWAIHEDKHSSIWVGVLSNGIDIYNPSKNTFKHIYAGGKEGLIAGSIHVLFKDSKDRMWVGGETNGLAVFDESTDSFYKFNTTNSTGLLSDKVKIIFEDSFNQIWVGYDNGGLCLLLDEKKRIFKSYGIAEGLAGKSAYSILEDKKKNLWIGTENGLSIFNVSDKSFRNFDVSDGIISNEFMYGAMLKDSYGNMHFGSTEGIIYFNPDNFSYNSNPPPIFITALQVFTNEVKNSDLLQTKDALKNLHLTKQLILRPEDYIITLEFAALDYLAPSKNRYAYILEGFDKNWVYTNASKRYATYTSLPAGNYTFRVKACNNDGVWNEKGLALEIKVLPHWWETLWFRFIAVLFLILIIVAIIYFLINIEKRRRVKLQRLVMERTAELKEANEELNKVNQSKDKLFSIVSHDLRGPANSMKKLSEMLEKNFSVLQEEEKSDFVSYIRKSADAQATLVNNLLNWARVQRSNIAITKSETNAEELIYRVINSLELQAKEKEISLEASIKADTKLFVDKNMIETVLRNLVNNAIKFTPQKGTIRINQETKDTVVIISIKDSGVGIKKEVLNALFKTNISTKGTLGETGTGLGLIICKEFTEANDGKLEVKSTPGEGTEFRIVFDTHK